MQAQIVVILQEVTVRLRIVTGSGHGRLIQDHVGPGLTALSVATIGSRRSEPCLAPAVTARRAGAGPARRAGHHGQLPQGRARRHPDRPLGTILHPRGIMSHPDPRQVPVDWRRSPWHTATTCYFSPPTRGRSSGPASPASRARSSTRTSRCPAYASRVGHPGRCRSHPGHHAVVVAVAATIGRVAANRPLNDVQQISQALTPVIGLLGKKVIFELGMRGVAAQ